MNESTNNALQVNSIKFGSEKDAYCSMPTETVEQRKLIARALEHSDALVKDCVNQSFKLIGVYSEKKMVVKLNAKKEPEVDEKTGEVVMIPKYRTILFAEDGKTYATGAYGIYSSVGSLFYVYGEPSTWEKPIDVKIIEKKLTDGKTTLKLEY